MAEIIEAGDLESVFASDNPLIQEIERDKETRKSVGTWEAFKAGVGRTAENIGAGAEDLLLEFAQSFHEPGTHGYQTMQDLMNEIDIEEAQAKEAYAPIQSAYPVTSTVGSALPYLATGAIGGGVKAMMGIGAAEGFIGHEESFTDRLVNAGLSATGAGVGYGVGRMAHRVTKNIKNLKGVDDPKYTEALQQGKGAQALDDAMKHPTTNPSNQFNKEIDILDKGDYLVTPAYRSGNKTAIKMENTAASNYTTGRVFNDIKAHNQVKLNETVANAIGVKGAKELGQDVLAQAQENFQASFNQAARNGKRLEFLAVERKQLQDLAKYGIDKLVPNSKVEKIASNLDDIISGKGITAKQYVSQRGTLTKVVKAASKQGDFTEEEAVAGLVEMLDNAFMRSNPGRLKALNRTREQYRIYMNLLKGAALKERGDVNLRTFANNLKSDMPRQYREGRFREGMNNESIKMLDEIRSLNRLEELVPSSGTAERLSMQDMSATRQFTESVGGLAGKAYMKAGNTKQGQAMMNLSLGQLFNTEPMGACLMEAYMSAAGIGAANAN